MKRSELKANPEKVRAFVNRGRRSSATGMKRGTISPASPEQREAVRDRLCVHCGAPGGCDPAHLTSRAQGGCDDPLCVVALCRTCHRDFDEGNIDLSPILALPEFAAERSHMASHLSLPQCLHRLSGVRWAPVEAA